MILLDKPYISDYLVETIKKNGFAVVDTDVVKEMGLSGESFLVDEKTAIQLLKDTENRMLYTNSENSIGWVAKHLPDSDILKFIDVFKDKVKFRKLTASLYPEFYFKEVLFEEIETINIKDTPFPFIIKPAVGFFSMGVYKVSDFQQWKKVKSEIMTEMRQVKDLYPLEVMDAKTFIIEECIEGEEYAFDACYDCQGEPIIFNIYKHVFSSGDDVSDRVYITSKEIIESNMHEFKTVLKQFGKLMNVKNMPLHVEVRVSKDGKVLPIEVNPMRFGGWCTTADMTPYAFGFNPYEYYFSQKSPDWQKILSQMPESLFAIIVLDNSSGVESCDINSFDYELLLSEFEKPLELRKVDFHQYPVFGFLFTETSKENFAELENILTSDLKKFINL